MSSAVPKIVALIGAGVIGRGWIRVFAPHGAQVRVYDPNPAQIPQTLAWLAQDLAADVAEGFVTAAERDTVLKNTHGEGDLAKALADADYVQESAPEKLDVKHALFAELDRLAPAKTIIASSTSALDIGEIAKGLPGQRRCVMAHPFNPPHLMPVVEMLGAPGTDPAILQKACDMLAACGQIPVRMNRYVKGFLGNRIQAAVVREALHLVETGVADAVAVDAVIRDALALRWATIGNFGANHANADEGIAQYFSRYAGSYAMLMEDLDSASPRFDPKVLRQIADAIEAREGVKGVPAFVRKRDVMVKELNQLKRRHEAKKMSPQELSGRPQNVVVTAAGQSVGRAMAEKFLARGDNVHICDIDAKLLGQVLAANPKLGGTTCDVGDEDQVAKLFNDARSRMGPIDVLVNTVGIAGPRGPIETLSLADWRATMAANLDSMFLTIRQVVPDMRRNKRGAIVNFSTGSTKTVMPFRSPYVASKAGVEGLTKSLARELGPDNIRINAILPGMIDNERMRGIIARIAEQEGRSVEAVEQEALNFISMRTKIQPAELADMVLFLCSDAARHITGQMIGVDGNIEWEA